MGERLRLLDLFCGAGGAGMGYHSAGFEVTGVDIKPQPRNPGNSLLYPQMHFVQADALEFLAQHGHEYDAIHASPPCQEYTVLRSLTGKSYPDLVGPVRELLIGIGSTYVIENVPGAPLIDPAVLCGTMFGLQTDCGAELRRHRLFETNWGFACELKCNHFQKVIGVYGDTPRNPAEYMKKYPHPSSRTISVHGTHPRDPSIARANRVITIVGRTAENPATSNKHSREARARVITVVGKSPVRTITVTGNTPQQNTVKNKLRETFSVAAARKAMGINWMVMSELSQAIPPAYTEFIGRQLLTHLEAGS